MAPPARRPPGVRQLLLLLLAVLGAWAAGSAWGQARVYTRNRASAPTGGVGTRRRPATTPTALPIDVASPTLLQTLVRRPAHIPPPAPPPLSPTPTTRTVAIGTHGGRAQSVPNNKVVVAVCAAIHSGPGWRTMQDSALQTILIPSLARSISKSDRAAYTFRLYLAADHDDTFWIEHQDQIEAPDWLSVRLEFYEVPAHKIPFNPMMRAAFDDGAAYMVRVNDDSEFLTPNWVSKGMQTLLSYSPPNVGMVGPESLGDNQRIMTHDMVHRTHLDIFEHCESSVRSLLLLLLLLLVGRGVLSLPSTPLSPRRSALPLSLLLCSSLTSAPSSS